jgi:hypothetical protein
MRIPALCLGYPVPGRNKYRNLAFQVGGVSKIETIKYAHESRGTHIRGRLCWRWTTNTNTIDQSFRQTGLPTSTNPQLSKNNWREKGNLVRMDLGEVGWGDVDWIGLAQDRNRWRALVNSVLNLRGPWNTSKLSSGLTCSGLLSSAQLHRVS